MSARRWIRLDVGWSTSAWLVPLSPAARLAWIELLGYVKTHGSMGRVRAMAGIGAARMWGIPVDDIEAMLSAAKTDGALLIELGEWIVTGWGTYQEPDRTAAERMRKYRADKSRLSPLRRNTVTDTPVTANTGVTRRVTETVTETEGKEKSTKEKADDAKPRARKRTEYPPEFAEIWSLHPRGPKPKALEEYRAAVPERVQHDKLAECLGRYCRTELREDFHGHDLFRWIRDDRWEEYANGARRFPPASGRRGGYHDPASDIDYNALKLELGGSDT